MPHSVTQQSPAEMLLGRPMRTQLDLLREDARRSVMEAYQRKQKAQYDVRAQPRIFQVGDKVYMYVLPPVTSGRGGCPEQSDRSMAVHVGFCWRMGGPSADILIM